MIIPNLFYPCLFSLLHSLFWFSSKFSHCFQRELSVKSFPAHTDLVMFSSHVQTKWEPSWTQPPWLSVTSPSLQFSSVIQLCPTLCNPMDCSMPGLLVHHQLPKLTQTHVHWAGDAIQPSHSLPPSSPPALSLSQHQGLFPGLAVHRRWPKYWSFSSASVPPMNIQGWFPLGWTGLISLPMTIWWYPSPKGYGHHQLVILCVK